MLAPDAYAGARVAGCLDTANYGLPPNAAVSALEEAIGGWRSGQDRAGWEAAGEAIDGSRLPG